MQKPLPYQTHPTKNVAGERGQILILVLLFFAAISVTVLGGVAAPIISELRMGSDLQTSKQSYFAAEGGSEDAYYRIRNNQTTSFPETLTLGGASVSVNVTTLDLTDKEIIAEGNARSLIRDVVKDITVTDGFDFNFAMQTGVGGISLNNNSVVNGNVYANGPVVGGSSNPNSYNIVNGSIVSAGSSGLVNQIHATSSVYSHTITNAVIDQDAFYQTFARATSSVSVAGVKHPDSADQPPAVFPVSDTLISQWEGDAAAGGIVTCTNGAYVISSSVTIGPKKIPCDLTISGNGTVVTLTGTLWVVGNISITGNGGSGVQVKVADSVGNKSVAIIADNAGNPTSSGLITINGNSNFYGSTGNSTSYVMLVSQNASAEQGGGNLAINVVNGAAGNLLIYAAHGQIELQNNVNLREVTAYKITLINNAVVNYSIGLAQSLLTSGSGGAWKIKRWKETGNRP